MIWAKSTYRNDFRKNPAVAVADVIYSELELKLDIQLQLDF